jgi:hypothetical protein
MTQDKIIVTMKTEEPYLKIKYKNVEYKIDDLFKESNDLLKELILPDKFNLNFFITDTGLFNDKGYAVAGEKYNDLYSVIASARFALYNAHLKIHNDQSLLKSEYSQTLWLRSQYLQNSIIWYNSSEDYIMQIIWFAFDFYTDLTHYSDEMRKCRYTRIHKELLNHNDSFNTADLLKQLESYHNNEDVKYVRELADCLKHKQMLNIAGLDSGRLMKFKSKSFSSDLLEKTWIDIDDTIKRIGNVHKLIIEFGTFLFDFIDFDAMFVFNKEGSIMLGQTRNKRDYKKVIINENFFT